jgi:sugar lactone lactonase YvrE
MAKLKRLFLILAILIALVALYLLLWPVPISPQAWTPPTAPPLTAQFEQNSLLSTTERLSLGTGTPGAGAGFGPEDVALDTEGRIYAGLDDGRIMRLQANGTKPEVFSNTHGRPLGLVFDPSGWRAFWLY